MQVIEEKILSVTYFTIWIVRPSRSWLIPPRSNHDCLTALIHWKDTYPLPRIMEDSSPVRIIWIRKRVESRLAFLFCFHTDSTYWQKFWTYIPVDRTCLSLVTQNRLFRKFLILVPRMYYSSILLLSALFQDSVDCLLSHPW